MKNRKIVTVYFDDGDGCVTPFNGSLDDIVKYYLGKDQQGKFFTFWDGHNNCEKKHKCVKVEIKHHCKEGVQISTIAAMEKRVFTRHS